MPTEGFYLGGVVDGATGERTGELVDYDPGDLTTHGVIVGMTGSGKTGLGIIYLEEALLSGIPALILDPKGDMTNLLLTFPELRSSDFELWIDEGEARKEDKSVPSWQRKKLSYGPKVSAGGTRTAQGSRNCGTRRASPFTRRAQVPAFRSTSSGHSPAPTSVGTRTPKQSATRSRDSSPACSDWSVSKQIPSPHGSTSSSPTSSSTPGERDATWTWRRCSQRFSVPRCASSACSI